MKNVIIIGANSDIGIACAHKFKTNGYEVSLAARRPADTPKEFDSFSFDVTKDSISKEECVKYDVVVYVAGVLGNNEENLYTDEKENVIEVNFTAATRILSVFAEAFKDRKSGAIIGVSSVAAVRGKGSTVIYGAAKAGFDSFLSGLRNILHGTGVNVVTIRPGYVNTKMVEGLTLPKSLTASPEQVASTIVGAVNSKRNIIYVKSAWRFIMHIIQNIPERIFKRMKL